MRTHRIGRRASGFTLVEVMVALLVMAVMAVVAWQGVSGIVRTRDAAQARLEQMLRFNTVIAQWDQDLLSVQETLVIPKVVSCDGASVRLVRKTPDGLQVVVWSLRPDDRGSTWVRWAGPSVTTVAGLTESWMRSLQLQGGEDGSLKTIGGLASWQVYFFRNNAWSNCQSTGETQVVARSSIGTAMGPAPKSASSPTPSPGPTSAPGGGPVTVTEKPPAGVRIVLEFQPGDGTSGELIRETLLTP